MKASILQLSRVRRLPVNSSHGQLIPTHVAEWSAHSAAMCSTAWHAQWPRFAPQPGHISLPKNYF